MTLELSVLFAIGPGMGQAPGKPPGMGASPTPGATLLSVGENSSRRTLPFIPFYVHML